MLEKCEGLLNTARIMIESVFVPKIITNFRRTKLFGSQFSAVRIYGFSIPYDI